MKNIVDYTILKRNSEGFAAAKWQGSFAGKKGTVVVARVMREDDNQTVIPWQLCKTKGKKWEVTLNIPQGGLYRLEARVSAEPFTQNHNRFDWSEPVGFARHVGVGEIFVMAGQSNMSAYGRDAAYDPPVPGVHLYDNCRKWDIASHPLNSVVNPVDCNNDTGAGTSPGLAFGRMMQKRLGVPIGLISAARGGSSLEDWNPNEKEHELYDAMIEKIEDVGDISGMIWAQGCNETNAEECETYLKDFTAAVKAWRKKLGDFPIVSCQINKHAYKGGGDDRFWGFIREAQRQAALTIDNVFVVPTLDMYTTDGIHNGSGACVIIGERMASALLCGYYGMPGSLAPNLKNAIRVSSNQILLTFHKEETLRTMDTIATGIEVEDETGIIPCTEACEHAKGILITAARDFRKGAKFHAYYRRETPAFLIRNPYGLPMLACYNVPIEE